MTTSTRTKRIAATLDLNEPLNRLDDLMLDDNTLVDIWGEETHVYALGDDAAVEITDAGIEQSLRAGLRKGWGREPELPEGVTVERFDRDPDYLDPSSSIVAEDRRERFTTWRMVETALIPQEA